MNTTPLLSTCKFFGGMERGSRMVRVLVLIGSIPRCLDRGAKCWVSVSAEKTELPVLQLRDISVHF